MKKIVWMGFMAIQFLGISVHNAMAQGMYFEIISSDEQPLVHVGEGKPMILCPVKQTKKDQEDALAVQRETKEGQKYQRYFPWVLDVTCASGYRIQAAYYFEDESIRRFDVVNMPGAGSPIFSSARPLQKKYITISKPGSKEVVTWSKSLQALIGKYAASIIDPYFAVSPYELEEGTVTTACDDVVQLSF
ncbi:MAG: hypothetical protein KDK51_05815 [Deltaproteobacteria bacterium]|nr:hypothetical protein [Deltaproteobacteria bacterium]